MRFVSAVSILQLSSQNWTKYPGCSKYWIYGNYSIFSLSSSFPLAFCSTLLSTGLSTVMPGPFFFFPEQLHSIKIPAGCVNSRKYTIQSHTFLMLIPLATVVFVQLLRLGFSSLFLTILYSKQNYTMVCTLNVATSFYPIPDHNIFKWSFNSCVSLRCHIVMGGL